MPKGASRSLRDEVNAAQTLASLGYATPTDPTGETSRAKTPTASVSCIEAVGASLSIAEQKHRKWCDQLKKHIERSPANVRQLLTPATNLGPVDCARHISSLPPSSLLLFDEPLKKFIIRFQERAEALNLIELLPKFATLTEQAHLRRQGRARAHISRGTRLSERFDAPTGADVDEEKSE